jgi:hypothetical protein
MGLKDEYFATMMSQFKRWDAEFGMLSDKAAEATVAAGEEQLKTMRASRDAAYRKLQEMRTASESGWRGMQTGVDEAWDSIRAALDHARSRK